MTSPLANALRGIAHGADFGSLPSPEDLRSGADRRRRRTTIRVAAAVAVACAVVVLALTSIVRSSPSPGPVTPAPDPAETERAEDADASPQHHPIAPEENRFSAHAIAAVDGRFVVVGDSSDVEEAGPPVYWSDDGVDWHAPTTGNGPDSVNVTDVIATDGGLLAVGVGADGTAAWRSVDGESWVESPVASAAAGAAQLWGITATRFGYFAWGFQGRVAHLWRSDDGATWSPVGGDAVFDLPQREAVCVVRDTDEGLRATGVVAPAGTREGRRVAWSSTDGDTWILEEAAGDPTFWCDPSGDLGHWEARGDAGVVRVDPNADGNIAELVSAAEVR